MAFLKVGSAYSASRFTITCPAHVVSSEFNRQMDLRVLELWDAGRYREVVGLLPEYATKCSDEALMADTAMLFGMLGREDYRGTAERLCDYFPSSGTGQVNVEFHLP